MIGWLVRLSVTGLVGLSLLTPTTATAALDGKKHAPLRCAPAPLLQPGKNQLMERVLVRPGAQLATAPGASGGPAIPAFSVLYVYDRSDDGKAVQVGGRSDCHPQGWLASDAVIPWNHAIAVAFANRTGRGRALFFGDQTAARKMIQAADVRSLAAAMEAKEQGPGLVSIEPKTPVDIRSHFYLLPVLDFAQDGRFASNSPTQLLRVAAISAPMDKAGGTDKGDAKPKPGTADVRRTFRTAVVFVVDATKSTQPYIDRMRQAFDKFYARIEAAQLQDRVRFGLIGYRDDPQAVPRIEYLTRTFVDPNRVASRAEFNRLAAGLKASTISSRAEAEDGFSGINAAIEGINWDEFAGRFVVMITDASSRNPGPLAQTPYDATHTRLNASTKDIALLAVHLLTPEGSSQDHATGDTQYRDMTSYPGRRALYYPIQAGDLAKFGTAVETIAESLLALVMETEESGSVIAPPAKPDARSKEPAPPPAIANDIAAIGHAMRLTYLGKETGSSLPPMFDAWTADRDYSDPTVQSLSPGVFLTKAELSDLQATVRTVSEAFNSAKLEPTTLYAQLRNAALILSRDPAALGSGNNKDINQAILGEYLDGLPYTSRVMAIDQEAWINMDVGVQQEIIDSLGQKARIYQRMHDDVANWVKLAEDAAAEDAVYLVPLDVLP